VTEKEKEEGRGMGEGKGAGKGERFLSARAKIAWLLPFPPGSLFFPLHFLFLFLFLASSAVGERHIETGTSSEEALEWATKCATVRPRDNDGHPSSLSYLVAR